MSMWMTWSGGTLLSRFQGEGGREDMGGRGERGSIAAVETRGMQTAVRRAWVRNILCERQLMEELQKAVYELYSMLSDHCFPLASPAPVRCK